MHWVGETNIRFAYVYIACVLAWYVDTLLVPPRWPWLTITVEKPFCKGYGRKTITWATKKKTDPYNGLLYNPHITG